MNNYGLNNQYYQNTQNISNEELKKRLESQENFGAIDTQKLKQDTVDLAQKQVKENWLFKTMRNSFGIENPKKFLISLCASIVSVIGVAWLGNKFAFKSIDLGSAIDKFFKGNSKIAKGYQGITNKFNSIVENTKNIFKNNPLTKKAYKDISETFNKRHARAKFDGARGYGEGFKGIHSMTIVETIEKAFQKNDGTPDVLKATESLTKIVGESKAKDLAAKIFKTTDGEKFTNIEISRELLEAIDKNFKLNGDKSKLIDILKQLKKGSINGVDVSEFTNITMATKHKSIFGKVFSFATGGVMSDWWPVNVIDTIGSKLFKNWKPFGKGNLGDAIGKFAAIDGKLADTLPGRIAQKAIIMPTESFSNFVNDKSGAGVLICATSIMNLFNNIQDAPKEQKLPTLTNDIVTSMTSFALSTPLAYKATYALASLKNLEGTSIITKILKPFGKFFGMGLDSIAKDGTKIINKNGITGKLGGVLRFTLIMFVFASFISKHISSAVSKIFGKPYDPSEAAQQKAQEEQLNQIIPELGISQRELMEKLQNNPQVAEKINSNPQLLQEIQKNPKILLDMLNGTTSNTNNLSVPQNNPQKTISPLNQKIINQRRMAQGQQPIYPYPQPQYQQPQYQQPIQQENNLFKPASDDTQNAPQKTTANLDTATYIPSSQFSAPKSALSEAKIQEINLALAKADKVLKEAEKYI